LKFYCINMCACMGPTGPIVSLRVQKASEYIVVCIETTL
jgi:hypothetical protein